MTHKKKRNNERVIVITELITRILPILRACRTLAQRTYSSLRLWTSAEPAAVKDTLLAITTANACRLNFFFSSLFVDGLSRQAIKIF